MKRIISFLSFFVVTNVSLAQTISGIVLNADKKIVAGATVRTVSQQDSTVTAAVVTRADGAFSISLSEGTWILMIDALGYIAYKSEIRVTGKTMTQLRDIVLQQEAVKELEAVTLKSKKPLLEHSVDRTTVNVDAMISSSSSNILEVLSRTPGVQVDNNGGISLNGKGGVLVLIDGRQTYMSAQDLSSYLKSLPGATLDKIELIDNPPARYDAAGNSIINLQLKKRRAAGWTGGFSSGYSQGRYARHNYAANLNYSYKKINLYTNIGHNRDKSFSEDIFDRNYYEQSGDLSSSVLLNNWQQYNGKSINIVTGLDYQLSSKTSMGVMMNINYGKRYGHFDYQSFTSASGGHGTGRGNGNTASDDRRNNIGLNINMLHKFKQQGHELSIDANHMRYKTRVDQEIKNFAADIDGNRIKTSAFAYAMPSDIFIYSAKADYVQPFLKGSFESGVKTSFVSNDNVSDFFDRDGAIPVLIEAMSNHFIYKENINAAYLSSRQQIDRFTLQAGLRVEQTGVKGHQAGNSFVQDSSFRRRYWNWFPSAAVSYKVDSSGQRQISFLYSVRVNRPNYQSLNPFIFYRDNYTYSGGNPLLNPQIQTRYELKYQHGQRWWAGLSYNNFTDVILPVTEVKDSLYITTPNNYARGYMVLLNLGISISPAKWWNINSVMRISRMGLRARFDNIKLAPNTNVFRWEFNNYFTVSKKIVAELYTYYASTDLNGQNATSGMYRINAGVQYKVSERGSVRLNVDDMFYSWKYHNRSIGLVQADYTQVSWSDTQRFGISFNYRFGKKASKTRRSQDNEESGRAQ